MIPKQKIKFIRSLQHKKNRDENKLFVIEGAKLVHVAINFLPSLIKEIYISSGYRSAFKNVPKNSLVTEISEEEFVKISFLKTPQGILALMDQPSNEFPNLSNLNDIVIALDRISDPGNLGTIIRLADWFGIRNIICSNDTVDCYNPKVVQASMGGILCVKVNYTNLYDFILDLKKKTKFKIYGTSLDGENLYQTSLKEPALIIMGNESNGISKDIRELIDQYLFIPNYSPENQRTESLNVSIASAIVCSEFRRQLGLNYSK